jgi:hypothetical protein
VTVAAVLLLYAACVGTLGAQMLGRAAWPARAPLLAIVTYLSAAWSVVAALGLAGLTLAVQATALGGELSHLIGACVLRLRDAYATPGGAVVAELGLTLTGAVAARTALTAVTHLRAVRRHAIQHAQAAHLTGQRAPGLGAVLVDHAQPAAYCVAGPHPTVIVTTATLRALDSNQLDAVLAHERAHLAYHHHRLLAIARIGRQVLPFIPLTRQTATHVTRLIEMHADDVATAGRDAGVLASALVALATASPAPGPAAPGLAAAATDAVQRIQRMLGPAEPLGRARRRLLRAGVGALALAPVLLALAPAAVALALGRVPLT